MSRFDNIRNATQPRVGRLETPSMTGFRPGMSSSSIIARKLGTVYDVPAERKQEIECALQTLDRRMASGKR